MNNEDNKQNNTDNIEETSREKLTRIMKIDGWVICGLMFLSGALFTGFAIKLNALTTPIIAGLIAVLVIVTAVFAILQRWLVPGIITKVLALVITTFLVIGSSYLETTNRALAKMSGTTTQIDNVHVYVLSDSPYGSVQELGGEPYGIISSLDRENTDKATAQLAEELGTAVQTTEYEGILELIQALYDGDVEAVILNSSFITILSEAEGYTDVEKNLRSIWDINIETEVEDSFANIDPDETLEGEDFEDYLYSGEDVFTIYISGIDVKGSPMVNRNSDVNILMTVNINTRQILLISTPRDYYVPLSISNGNKDKLTHAGCYGVEVSMDTLGMLYDIEVTDYVKMNFTGFVEIIDLLGGVEVYSEYDFSVGGYSFHQGYNTLNGEQALAFARERHSFAIGDRQRGKNQMAVIEAVIKKVTSSEMLKNYNSVLSAVSDSVATSVTYDRITDLVKMQLSDMRGWEVLTYSVNGTDSNNYCYSLGTNAYVMQPIQPTVDKAKEYLQQIYNNEYVVIVE